MNVQPADQEPHAPQPGLWRKLLSGNRERIADAVAQISAAQADEDYVPALLKIRRRRARREWTVMGVITFTMAYSERERRSALSALSLLWGAAGRELGLALDPKRSHFEREQAHKALVRRRDQRAVGPLLEALIDGHALEDWQCIATLGALGDQRAVDGLVKYVGLDPAIERPPQIALDYGLEVGRALRSLNARDALRRAQQAIIAPQIQQRVSAALVLAGWGDEALAPSLLPLLEDESPVVRAAAATGLGELKASDADAALQNVLNDPDAQVRQAAERALQQVPQDSAARPGSPRKFRRANLARR